MGDDGASRLDVDDLDAGGRLPSGAGSAAGSHRPVVWIGLAVACLAGGMLLVGQGLPSAPVIAPPPPAPRPVPVPVRTPDGYGLGSNLVLGAVCPTFSVGPGVLAVSFEIANFSQNTVTLTELEAVPPRGYRRVGPITSGGSCAAPGDGPGVALLDSAESRLFTVRLNRPACAGDTVEQLRLRGRQIVGITSDVSVLDLGPVRFAPC